MTKRLNLFFFILLCRLSFSQVFCDSLGFDKDTLATLDGKQYTGHCFSYTKRHVIRRHLVNGCVDTIVFMDKKQRLETVETVTNCSDFGSYKRFYRNGIPRQIIEMKDGGYYGFYREYYKNGKIKYEAEYGDSAKIINDTYYTWDKKGNKYMHTRVETSKEIRRGNLVFHSAYERRKKIKVKTAD